MAELVEALGRPALHAKSLGFTHPITGQRLQFTSDLPPDFQVRMVTDPRCRAHQQYSMDAHVFGSAALNQIR